MTRAGAAGTAGAGFRVPDTAGRHRAPPPPPRPKAPAVIAAAAGILGTSAMVAILGTSVAPTASASPRSAPPMAWVAEPTLPRTYGPLRMPVIGALPTSTPSEAADAPAIPQGVTRTPETTPAPRSEPLVAIPVPSTATGNVATTTQAPTKTTTPTSTETTAAATTTSSPGPTTSEETHVDETPSPTSEPTQTTEPTETVDVEITDQTTGGEE